jgi:hypothetical protein
MIGAGKLHIVHVDRRAHSCTCCERNVDRFECAGLHAPPVEPGLYCVEVVLEFQGLSDARISVSSAKVAVVVAVVVAGPRFKLQDYNVVGRIRLIKKSYNLIGNRTRDLPTYIIVPEV